MQPVVYYRGAAALAERTVALRLIYGDLFRRGILPDEVANYRQSSDWFPWLKERPEIEALRPPGDRVRTTTPQIVFQPPDQHEGELVFHVDADDDGEPFAMILGVALTRQTPENGGLSVLIDGRRAFVTLDAGDVFAMEGTVAHASGANLTGEPRVVIYFRVR